MRRCLREFIERSDGQDLLEYAMLGSLISLAAVATMTGLQATLGTLFQTMANQLEQ